MKRRDVKSSSAKKNKPSKKKVDHKKVAFIKLLIRISMKEANNSTGVIRDFFLQQALRLDSELEKMESLSSSDGKIKGTA